MSSTGVKVLLSALTFLDFTALWDPIPIGFIHGNWSESLWTKWCYWQNPTMLHIYLQISFFEIQITCIPITYLPILCTCWTKLYSTLFFGFFMKSISEMISRKKRTIVPYFDFFSSTWLIPSYWFSFPVESTKWWLVSLKW